MRLRPGTGIGENPSRRHRHRPISRRIRRRARKSLSQDPDGVRVRIGGDGLPSISRDEGSPRGGGLFGEGRSDRSPNLVRVAFAGQTGTRPNVIGGLLRKEEGPSDEHLGEFVPRRREQIRHLRWMVESTIRQSRRQDSRGCPIRRSQFDTRGGFDRKRRENGSRRFPRQSPGDIGLDDKIERPQGPPLPGPRGEGIRLGQIGQIGARFGAPERQRRRRPVFRPARGASLQRFHERTARRRGRARTGCRTPSPRLPPRNDLGRNSGASFQIRGSIGLADESGVDGRAGEGAGGEAVGRHLG
mmetsp:Transcript_18250/g.37478  ORF Transcript_18250/g.37478 Transcript_18250/m.37478 type:complete len:301 (+) Transcript_18250:738-1640(+)